MRSSGSLVSRKFSMRMSWLGVERPGDAAGDGIQLDADEAHALAGHGS